MKKKSTNNNLYNFILMLIFIIVIITIAFLLFFNKNKDLNYKLSFKYDQINTYLDKYKDYEIELTRSVDNNLYGMVYDSSKNEDLFVTIGEFIYDYNSDTFQFFKNKNNNRVVDFYKYNDKLFKISLEYYDKNSSYYKWKVTTETEDSKSKPTTLTGIISNIFMYPLIIVDNDNFYIAALNRDISGVEEFNLYNIEDDKIKEVYKQKKSSNRETDRMIYDIANMKIINNHFVYSYMNFESHQYLIDYDLENRKEEVLYINKDTDYSIYNYLYRIDYKYLQLINKNEKNSSKIVVINNSDKYLLESKILTFENIIKGNIISHNANNVWNVFDPINKESHDIKLTKKIDCYPKFLNINDDIIVLGYDNNIYSSSLVIDNN